MTSKDLSYKPATSGGIAIDPTLLGGVLDTFKTTFSALITNIATPFAGMSESLGKVAAAFSSMAMTHTFTGNIAMSVNIANKDAIIAAVEKGISAPDGPIATLITNHINSSMEELKNSSTV